MAGLAKSVLIADDDAGARSELARVLEASGYVVHEASNGQEALATARAERPAIALLEIPLAVFSGYEVCRALKAEHGSDIAVLFLSGQRKEPYDRVAGLLLGADDYLVKPYAADELLARLRRLEAKTRPLAIGVHETLSPREAEVLRLLADGSTQHEIAHRLGISPKTVGSHIEHILRKLGVHSRAQAVARAFREDAAPLAS